MRESKSVLGFQLGEQVPYYKPTGDYGIPVSYKASKNKRVDKRYPLVKEDTSTIDILSGIAGNITAGTDEFVKGEVDSAILDISKAYDKVEPIRGYKTRIINQKNALINFVYENINNKDYNFTQDSYSELKSFLFNDNNDLPIRNGRLDVDGIMTLFNENNVNYNINKKSFTKLKEQVYINDKEFDLYKVGTDYFNEEEYQKALSVSKENKQSVIYNLYDTEKTRNLLETLKQNEAIENNDREKSEKWLAHSIKNDPRLYSTVLHLGSAVDPEPWSSLVLGLAGTATELYADINSDVSNAYMYTNLGLNLGTDVLSMATLVGGGAPKLAMLSGKIAAKYPKLYNSIKSSTNAVKNVSRYGVGPLNVKNASTAALYSATIGVPFSALSEKDADEWTDADFRNLLAATSNVVGGVRKGLSAAREKSFRNTISNMSAERIPLTKGNFVKYAKDNKSYPLASSRMYNTRAWETKGHNVLNQNVTKMSKNSDVNFPITSKELLSNKDNFLRKRYRGMTGDKYQFGKYKKNGVIKNEPIQSGEKSVWSNPNAMPNGSANYRESNITNTIYGSRSNLFKNKVKDVKFTPYHKTIFSPATSNFITGERDSGKLYPDKKEPIVSNLINNRLSFDLDVRSTENPSRTILISRGDNQEPLVLDLYDRNGKTAAVIKKDEKRYNKLKNNIGIDNNLFYLDGDIDSEQIIKNAGGYEYLNNLYMKTNDKVGSNKNGSELKIRAGQTGLNYFFKLDENGNPIINPNTGSFFNINKLFKEKDSNIVNDALGFLGASFTTKEEDKNVKEKPNTKIHDDFKSEDSNVVNNALGFLGASAINYFMPDKRKQILEDARNTEYKVTPRLIDYKPTFIPAAEGLNYDTKATMFENATESIQKVETSSMDTNRAFNNANELTKAKIKLGVDAQELATLKQSEASNFGLKAQEVAKENAIDTQNKTILNDADETHAKILHQRDSAFYEGDIRLETQGLGLLRDTTSGIYDILSGKQSSDGMYPYGNNGKNSMEKMWVMMSNDDKGSFNTAYTKYKNASNDLEKEIAQMELSQITKKYA